MPVAGNLIKFGRRLAGRNWGCDFTFDRLAWLPIAAHVLLQTYDQVAVRLLWVMSALTAEAFALDRRAVSAVI